MNGCFHQPIEALHWCGFWWRRNFCETLCAQLTLSCGYFFVRILAIQFDRWLYVFRVYCDAMTFGEMVLNHSQTSQYFRNFIVLTIYFNCITSQLLLHVSHYPMPILSVFWQRVYGWRYTDDLPAKQGHPAEKTAPRKHRKWENLNYLWRMQNFNNSNVNWVCCDDLWIAGLFILLNTRKVYEFYLNTGPYSQGRGFGPQNGLRSFTLLQ